jgi:hypothetical protein
MAKSEWKYCLDHDIGFKGRICHIFPQVFLLMQSSIAYYIPISGFPPRYPRVESFLRHMISLGFVIWYFMITNNELKVRKILNFIGLVVLHYVTAALFERHLISFSNIQTIRLMDNNSNVAPGLSLSNSSIFDAAVSTSANNIHLSPVTPTIELDSGNVYSRLVVNSS